MSTTLNITGITPQPIIINGIGTVQQITATGVVTQQGPIGPVGPTGPAGTTDYNALSNKPTIPTDNAQLTNGASYATTSALTSGLATKANTSSLATVATSGAYTDLTGKPTIPTVPTTVSSFTNDAGYTTTTALNTAVAGLVNSSPAALDTLGELATALGNDANFSTTVTNSIATKAPMLNPTAVKTANYTASANDFVPVDTTSGAVTITLPSAPANGTRFGVKMVIQGGSNTVTVTRGGSDVFNKAGGNTSVTVSLLNQGVQFQYSGGIWYGVAADIGLTALDARYAPISGSTLPATFTANGTVKQIVYNVRDYGAVGNGTTDDSTAIFAAISAASTAGGGTVYLPAGTYKVLSALTIPYTGTGHPIQKPIRITGDGANFDGFWPTSPLNGGTILDLRYDGTDTLHPAKIDTRGAGYLEIDHLTIYDGGTSNFKFMQTTNTTVFIHDIAVVGNTANTGVACTQDFIQMGGTSLTIGNGANAPFQGYGSKLHDNFYSNIQRGVVFGNYCNGIEIQNETYSKTCGSSLTFGAPYYSDPGAAGQAAGIRIIGGTLEITYYPYMVALIQNSAKFYFDNIGGYDNVSVTLGGIYHGASCTGNMIIAGFFDNAIPIAAGPGAAYTTVIDQRSNAPSQFPLGINMVTPSIGGGRADLAFNSTQGPHKWLLTAAYNDAHSISLVDVTNANAQRIIVLNSGNVGIGKVNPGSTLDVNGTATATSFTGSGAGLTSIPESAVTNLTTDLAAKAPVANPTFTGTVTIPTDGLAVGTTELVTSAGQVGIGTAPSETLHVKTANIHGVRVESTGSSNRLDFYNTTHNFSIRTNYSANGLEFLHVASGDPTTSMGIFNTLGYLGIKTTSPNSFLHVNGSIATAIIAKTAAYTATVNDSTITGDATTAAFNVTLPTAVGITGRIYTIKKTDASVNAVTIATTSSQTIDGATTKALSAQYAAYTVQSDGANWQIIGKV